MKSEVFLMDCMEGMRKYPDNHFDLAIVDPPYGLSKNNLIPGSKISSTGVKRSAYKHNINWSPHIPTDEYFKDLKRVSKNQIIWGANFYNNLTGGRIVWIKNNPVMSNADIAYHSFGVGIYTFEYTWSGMIQGDMKNKEIRIHPTQKPVKLYEWLMVRYAKEGDKILDTHLGSGSSRIAAHNLGFDFTGFEIDKEYFDAAEKRFKEVTSQLNLF